MNKIKDIVEDLMECYDGVGVPNQHYIRNKIAELYKVVLKSDLLPRVSISNEEIIEPIQNTLYSTDRLTTDQCIDLVDGILTNLNEAGYKVVIK